MADELRSSKAASDSNFASGMSGRGLLTSGRFDLFSQLEVFKGKALGKAASINVLVEICKENDFVPFGSLLLELCYQMAIEQSPWVVKHPFLPEVSSVLM